MQHPTKIILEKDPGMDNGFAFEIVCLCNAMRYASAGMTRRGNWKQNLNMYRMEMMSAMGY